MQHPYYTCHHGDFQEENWAERDIVISLLSNQRANTTPYLSDHQGYGPTALGQLITPLSEATLNGRTIQEAFTSPPHELSSRMKRIEDELYGGIPRHQPYHYVNQRQFNYNQYEQHVHTDFQPPYLLPHQEAQPSNSWAAPTNQHTYGPTPTHTLPKSEFEASTYQGPDSQKQQPPPVSRKRSVPEASSTNISCSENDTQYGNGSSDGVTSKKVKNEAVPKVIEEPEEGKDLEKALRSRESSRRYRQRKKECFEKMKKQLESFEAERRQWAKERDASLKAIEKLKSENELLKDKHNSEAVKFREERLALLAELDKKVKAGASDEELIPTLTQIKQRCQGIKQVSQSLLRQYISPDAATYLAGIGFFNDVDAIEVDRPSKEESLYSFAAKLEKEIPDLSEEQIHQIHGLVEQFYADIRKLVSERHALGRELQSLYNAEPLIPEAAPGGTAEPNTQMILERLTSLQQLRENLIAESDLSLTAISQMLDVLKPMQAAKFLVKVHFVHTSVMQLQMLWEALKASNRSCNN